MKLFVWDLHGTLEQGNERAVVEMSNKIASEFGYEEQFTEEDGRRLYGLRWYEYYEYLLPNEPHERHVELQKACFDFSNTRAGSNMIAKYIMPSKNAYKILSKIGALHE